MFRRHSISHLIILSFLLTLIAVGCSGSGSNPLQPSLDGQGDTGSGITLEDLSLTSQDVDAVAREAEGYNGPLTWGIFDVTWDSGSNQIVAVPLRTAEGTFNILKFLQPPDGDPANLSISITDPSQFMSEGIIGLDVIIHHPFPSPVFTGFDVIGVVIGEGSIASIEDPGVLYASDDNLQLLNGDGHTRWMNPAEFTQSGLFGYTEGILGTHGVDFNATINSFKYFAEGISSTETVQGYFANPGNVAYRGAFLPGSTISRNYILKFPMPEGNLEVKFQYAILAHWQRAKDQSGVPIQNPTIDDFPPEANIAEAVHVVVDTSGSTAYYIDETNYGGDLVLDITIYDWQGELSPDGVVDQVSELLIEAPSGMIPGGAASFSTLDLLAAQTSSGPTFTQIYLEIPNVSPTGLGETVLVVVRSSDPTDYDSGFGAPFPVGAELAMYRVVPVTIHNQMPNTPPVIDDMTGETAVNCFIGEEEYTVVAHDPDPGDTLSYKWEVTPNGVLPTFAVPLSITETCTVNWADNDTYPFGEWDVWVRVSDATSSVKDHLDVTKSDEQLIAGAIDAASEYVENVTCDVMGEYTANANDCNPDAILEYRFIRKFTTNDTPPDPGNPDWSTWQSDPTWTLGWNNTEIGHWRIWAHVREVDDHSVEDVSPALAIERINSPPIVPTPSGLEVVDCETITDYTCIVLDCDSGDTVVTQRYFSTDPDTPIGSTWYDFTGGIFTLNLQPVPAGDYWLFVRGNDGSSWVICDTPLHIEKINTPPVVGTPVGNTDVSCAEPEVYTVEITDCDGDDLQKAWQVSTNPGSPDGDWYSIIDNSFEIDWGNYDVGSFWIFTKARDDYEEILCNPSLAVNNINSPPKLSHAPEGETNVICGGEENYDVGSCSDCNSSQTVHRYWIISDADILPPSGDPWTEFPIADEVITVDWSSFTTGTWYVIQKATDGTDVSWNSLEVDVEEGELEVGIPDGPTPVSCIDTDAEYTVEIVDCDGGPEPDREWGLSFSDDPGEAAWFVFTDESFIVNWALITNGPDGDVDYYLFVRADENEGEGWVYGGAFVAHRLNTAPGEPDEPSGSTNVSCSGSPYEYDFGSPFDCDYLNYLTRYWAVSTDDGTPPPDGPDWHEFTSTLALVDWTGTPVGNAYLWQKVNDGWETSYGKPLKVTMNNSLPDTPSTPSGAHIVNCVTGLVKQYSTSAFSDCDVDQKEYTHWGVSTTASPGSVSTWHSYPGTQFGVDWGNYDPDTYYLFVQHNDGIVQIFSNPLEVTYSNTPPSVTTPTGPTDVNCADSPFSYDFGTVDDCDGQEISRKWAINTIDTPPTTGWTIFTTQNVDINFTGYSTGNLYLFQYAFDGMAISYSSSLHIVMQNSPPDAPVLFSGATSVLCEQSGGSTIRTYHMEASSDCDVGQSVSRYWAIGTSSDPGSAGGLHEYAGTTFDIDWGYEDFGAHWVHPRDFDGIDWTWGTPYQVTYINSHPETPSAPTGETDIYCSKVESYYVGTVSDCDHQQSLTRYWGINDTESPPWYNWTEFPEGNTSISVDWTGYELGTYYLYQFVFDGEFYDHSDPLVVNTWELPDDDAIFAVPLVYGGHDSNPGTKDDPVATLGVALTKANAAGYDQIYMYDETFSDPNTVNLIDGINVTGGCEMTPCWYIKGGTERSKISGHQMKILGSDIDSSTVIRNIEFVSTHGNASNPNSIPVYLMNCSNELIFENCKFRSGNGRNGPNGLSGMNGSNGSKAGDGESGDENDVSPCQSSSNYPGDGGFSSCGSTGGNGGYPGNWGIGWGMDGDDAPGPLGGEGGDGGDNDGGNGSSAQHGGSGADGTNGSSGNGSGYVTGGVWFPYDGEDGTEAQDGGGGGGGGGGGCKCGDDCCDNGGAGGGGGGGGCAGETADGGSGGGGSFCVFLWDSGPIFNYCIFDAGDGGDGGGGGKGGNGGEGGERGDRGWGHDGSGYGGLGGNGGDGGQGGHGGGGGGGVSYCAYRYGTSYPVFSACSFTAGSGGDGGSASLGGSPGQDGDSGNFYP